MSRHAIQQVVITTVLVMSATTSTSALSANAANAPVVMLRTTCEDGNSVTLNNCFTSMSSLTNWLWTIRNPSSTNPLLVEIGPGSFGGFSCFGNQASPRGWITLRGSGQGITKLASTTGQAATVKSDGCTDLVFENLTISQTHGDGAIGYAIQWLNGGQSVWNNVSVEAKASNPGFRTAGWYESGCVDGVTTLPLGKHYWFSSRIQVFARKAANTVGYSTQCPAESWFYGSEIDVVADASTKSSVSDVAGVEIGAGENQLFGAAIRVRVDKNAPSNVSFSRFVGVSSQFFGGYSGKFHMHGGIIAVDASASAQSFDVASAMTIDHFHAFETAFTLKAPTVGGSATRLNGGAKAPFMWEPAENPPSILSTNGSDTFIETDCSSAGCQAAGTETHLQIYNDSCTTDGPWFDSVTGRCRGL